MMTYLGDANIIFLRANVIQAKLASHLFGYLKYCDQIAIASAEPYHLPDLGE